jgi:periplasmic protein TonB
VIPRLPMATLLASLAVHGGAVAILFFLVSGESHPSVLFIDLEAIEERRLPAATTAAGGSGEMTGAPSGSPRAARSEAGRSSRPSAPAPARSSPAPSAAPSEPEPAREPEVSPAPAPEPRQPEPAVAVVPAREAAPDTPPRAESSSSPAEPAPNAGGAGSAGERVASPSEQDSGQAALTPGSSTQGSGAAGGSAGLGSGGPAGGAPGAEYGSYLAGVRQRILDALRYPPPARSRGLTGTVYLEIFIKSDGAIGDVAVTNSSSHPLLDEAALEAVRSLSPQPFPKGLEPRPLRVRLPVVFDLQ